MNNVIKKDDLSTKIQLALDKAVKKIVEEEKRNNGYIVVSDEKGNIKKIPAKDL